MRHDETVRAVADPARRDHHRVVTVAGPRVSMFEMAVACEVFGIFRPEIEGWPYVHEVVSDHDRLEGANGLTLATDGGLDRAVTADTVVVAPIPVANVSRQGEVQVDRAISEAVRAAHESGARIVSLCSGAFILAEAGLLDGRRATTHWMYAEQLADRYPAITVDPMVLWVEDHPIYTSAGTAAAIDLCLHLVREDLGAEAANRVARRMVVPPHRDGGQAQFVDTPVPDCPTDDPLGPVLTWMAEHVDQPMTVEQLARRAALSPRTFARRFVATTGTTPLQWLLTQRVARARMLLETTDLPIERIAQLCGFGTAAGLRTHFARVVGTSPTQYRGRFATEMAG
ncbi:helix-turn-helix domain-containing protein [Iamia sp. SCSIO 61187]|uniref:helix-turn-helix domain-containing protein n=1 Tax=Iamia sp. SCSIO 61187 TaxID=2722752 RepID=UPI001C637F6D|nr:helix-turn-helix domain-containing protein [Iamia sp. SCSIO 61187]